MDMSLTTLPKYFDSPHLLGHRYILRAADRIGFAYYVKEGRDTGTNTPADGSNSFDASSLGECRRLPNGSNCQAEKIAAQTVYISVS